MGLSSATAVKACLGAVLFLTGAAAMAITLAGSYGRSAACERLLFNLGLPGSLLLSSLAQCALFFGAWILWSLKAKPGPG